MAWKALHNELWNPTKSYIIASFRTFLKTACIIHELHNMRGSASMRSINLRLTLTTQYHGVLSCLVI